MKTKKKTQDADYDAAIGAASLIDAMDSLKPRPEGKGWVTIVEFLDEAKKRGVKTGKTKAQYELKKLFDLGLAERVKISQTLYYRIKGGVK